MARHCDPSLTANVYTHVTLQEQSRALAALPDLSAPFKKTAAGQNDLASCLAPEDASECISVRSDAIREACEVDSSECDDAEKTSLNRDNQADGEGFEPPVRFHVQQFSRLPP